MVSKLVEKFFKYILYRKTFKKLFSISYYNMNTNLLDLNNDILNIIGGYVKRDNERRIDKEYDFEKTDFIMNRLKENNKFNKYEIGEALYSQLFKNCCTEEEIKEYVETRKLKRYVKKYNLSKKR